MEKVKEVISALGESHFGMYIAGSKDPMFAKLEATMQMQSISYLAGFSYSPWFFCLDVQILKKLGVWDIDKLLHYPLTRSQLQHEQ
jgi:hypothetical protein